MLFSILNSSNIRMTLITILLTLPVVLISLSVHESAHGWVAYKCGDPTAKNLGRISLNPMKHFDPIGFLCMFLFGFGWAKPVPINTRNFRNPKKGMAITAAAGPLSNLLLGVVSVVFCSLFFALFCREAGLSVSSFGLYYFNTSSLPFQIYLLMALYYFFYFCAIMNFTLMIFNLIPIPPFDGSRIVTVFLPTNLYFRIMKYERQIMLGLLVVLFLLSRVFHISITAWLSERLFDLLYTPFGKLFFRLFGV